MHSPAFYKMANSQALAPLGAYKPPPGLVTPNNAFGNSAQSEATKVKIKNKPAIVKSSNIPNSIGAPVPATGLASNVSMKKTTFTKGSSKVKAQGKPMVYAGIPTTQNGQPLNTMGITLGGCPQVLVHM